MKREQAEKQNLKSGKWLIYVYRDNINDVWKKIKTATEESELGIEAKVATVIQSDAHNDRKLHVICVYTYDWTDIKDVKRVRQKLRDLGITNKISYKSDEDTIAGRYPTNGERIGKYYE